MVLEDFGCAFDIPENNESRTSGSQSFCSAPSGLDIQLMLKELHDVFSERVKQQRSEEFLEEYNLFGETQTEESGVAKKEGRPAVAKKEGRFSETHGDSICDSANDISKDFRSTLAEQIAIRQRKRMDEKPV